MSGAGGAAGGGAAGDGAALDGGTARTVVLATHNRGKVVELRDILGDALGGIELVAYDGPEPVEDGDTYAANALIKARAAVAHTGLPALADDSGIAVDALGGAPGIHSARYAGTRVDADNIALLLQNLDGVVERTAAFVCAAAFVTPSGVEHVFEALWNGEVRTEPIGDGGHGYDPVFQPDDADRSAAQLTRAEKNALSHRSKAFRGIAPIVREWFAGEDPQA